MKLISIKAQNFGSFKDLELNLDGEGLTLIDGDTGAGKSTLLDAVAWGLFGETPKGLGVNDVVMWGSKEAAVVEVTCTTKVGANMVVTRTRGKAHDNDLHLVLKGLKVRGKDITETQKIINETLGFDYDSFTIASYFTPSSVSAKFFEAKATDRRELFERLTNLSLPISLSSKVSTYLKDLKKEIASESAKCRDATVKHEKCTNLSTQLKSDYDRFEESKSNIISNLRADNENFEREKAEKILANLNKRKWWEDNKAAELHKAKTTQKEILEKLKEAKPVACSLCGVTNEETTKLHMKLEHQGEKIEEISGRVNPYPEELDIHNNYPGLIALELGKVNPIRAQIDRNDKNLIELNQELHYMRGVLADANKLELQLTQLNQASGILRGKIISKIIEECETETNRLLTDHFDAEFSIRLETGEKDNLDIVILKDSHQCSYRQLSKGQKCLLRLCFGVTLMQVAENNLGVNFNTVFFDEALDGLDAELKVKAYYLLAELEKYKGTIFLVEHSSEIKPLILNKIYVKINNEGSKLETAYNDH